MSRALPIRLTLSRVLAERLGAYLIAPGNVCLGPYLFVVATDRSFMYWPVDDVLEAECSA